MERGFRNPAAEHGRRRLFFITLLVLCILALDILSGGKIRTALRQTAAPLWPIGHALWSAVANTEYFSTRAALEQQIGSLRQQLADAQEQAAAYASLKQQYDALSQLTHLAQNASGVSARIISSLSSSPYGTFLIGAGSANGIVQGALVLDGADFAIGEVSDVGKSTALVKTVFAPGNKVAVTIDGASATLGGQGGESGEADVPQGVPIAIGDPVIAPQLGGKAVGIVEHVTSNPANALQNVYISLPVNLAVLQFVYVEL